MFAGNIIIRKPMPARASPSANLTGLDMLMFRLPRNLKASELPLREIFGEKLQRCRRLFEGRPKNGSGHEKHGDHQNAPFLIGVKPAERENVNKEQQPDQA
jgi:hypothetical protein